MKQRIDYPRVAPRALGAIMEMERYVRSSALEGSLIELVKLRASQINGCAFCVDMHSKDARAQGETEQRLHGLAVWREAPFYSPRERAALAWTEAVTQLSEYGAPDDLYEELLEHFTEVEVVDLAMTIATINAWNRMAVSFRPPVGDYQPGPVATVTSPSPA